MHPKDKLPRSKEKNFLSIGGRAFSSLHFAGIMGSGMSAIAQYLSWGGQDITGSDRIAFSDEMKETREKLEGCGCRIFPQDGTGIGAATEGLVISTAIEDDNPDIEAARGRGIPIVHRSDVLAAIVGAHRTIAVCGTSGKSTVAALIFEILRSCGKDPSIITGANLIRLNEKGLIGNAFRGGSDTLVIEADESDGTLVKYIPERALFLNISKDHKPVSEILELFQRLAGQTRLVIKNADDPGLFSIPSAHTFAAVNAADDRPDAVKAVSPVLRFRFKENDFEFPLPGKHNLSNARAALCVCRLEGCLPEDMVAPLRMFKGIERRFSISRTPQGITVIDDFAHNPEKIAAALLTARDFGVHIFGVFQPHGYGPTRFLKDELVDVFARSIRPADEAYLLPIFYAGGTAKKNISSEDLAALISERGVTCSAVRTRDDLLAILKVQVKSGDAVILMGARDPSLSNLAGKIKENLSPAEPFTGARGRGRHNRI